MRVSAPVTEQCSAAIHRSHAPFIRHPGDGMHDGISRHQLHDTILKHHHHRQQLPGTQHPASQAAALASNPPSTAAHLEAQVLHLRADRAQAQCMAQRRIHLQSLQRRQLLLIQRQGVHSLETLPAGHHLHNHGAHIQEGQTQLTGSAAGAAGRVLWVLGAEGVLCVDAVGCCSDARARCGGLLARCTM
jgi:hypothetical protein